MKEEEEQRQTEDKVLCPRNCAEGEREGRGMKGKQQRKEQGIHLASECLQNYWKSITLSAGIDSGDSGPVINHGAQVVALFALRVSRCNCKFPSISRPPLRRRFKDFFFARAVMVNSRGHNNVWKMFAGRANGNVLTRVRVE